MLYEVITISFKVQEGDTVEVGALACTIDTDAAGAPKETVPAAPAVEKKEAAPTPKAEKAPEKVAETDHPKIKTTAVAKEMMDEYHLSVDDIISGLQRIGKKEVETVISQPTATSAPVAEASKNLFSSVITSYSIHYTKLYDIVII